MRQPKPLGGVKAHETVFLSCDLPGCGLAGSRECFPGIYTLILVSAYCEYIVLLGMQTPIYQFHGKMYSRDPNSHHPTPYRQPTLGMPPVSSEKLPV